MKRILLILIAILLISTGGFAQMKKGKKLYDLFKYSKAIPRFEKVVKKQPGNMEAQLLLAHSYMMVNDMPSAEERYAIILEQDSATRNADVYMNYGLALKSNKKYVQAKEQFYRFQELRPDDRRGDQYLASCDKVMDWLKDEDAFGLINLYMVNTKESEFGPTYYKEGIVFTSARRNNLLESNIYDWTGKLFLDLFYAQKDSKLLDFPKIKGMSNRLNTTYHDGPASFTAEGKTVVFTRVDFIKARDRKTNQFVNRLKIFTSNYAHGDWSKPEPFYLNSDDHSVGHTSLTKDGQRMYFASDMPGTLGGVDIWYVDKQADGSWGKAQNLGDEVNTFADEMFPFIHGDGTLYFSSKGHVGYGGLDLFSAKMVDGQFTGVENLRSPLNGPADDFGLILDDEKYSGYLASNRAGGKGDDDIYYFAEFQDFFVKKRLLCKEIIDDGKCVTLDASKSVDPGNPDLIYEWEFPGNVIKQGLKVDHCFEEYGTYYAKLHVTDKRSGLRLPNEQVLSLNISEGSSVQITSEGGALKYNELVRFKASGKLVQACDSIKYSWNLGDGQVAMGKKVEHTYPYAGTYKVKLRMLGDQEQGDGYCNACYYKYITVDSSSLVVTFDVDTTRDSIIKADILLSGIVQDKRTQLPIQEAKVTLIQDTQVIKEVYTNATGEFEFAVGEQSKYVVEAHKQGYLGGEQQVRTGEKAGEDQRIFTKIDLQRTEDGITLNVNAVSRKGERLPEAILYVYEQRGDSLTKLSMNNQGTGRIFLEPGKEYIFKSAKSHLLSPCYTFSTMKMSRGDQLSADVILTPLMIGESIVLEHIYYDFDKYNIRQDASVDLDELVYLLENYPTMKIELGSHTDTRGTQDYNDRLSGQRARSAMKYLISKGISSDRITSRGYGESVQVNDCVGETRKASSCPEDSYEVNRRTEFKITEFDNSGLLKDNTGRDAQDGLMTFDFKASKKCKKLKVAKLDLGN